MSAEQIATIVAAVDYGTVIQGIVGVAAVVATVYVARAGARWVLGMIRG